MEAENSQQKIMQPNYHMNMNLFEQNVRCKNKLINWKVVLVADSNFFHIILPEQKINFLVQGGYWHAEEVSACHK